MRPSVRLLLAAGLVAGGTPAPWSDATLRAQAPAGASGAPLAITDLLDVRSTSVGSLSADGRWLYATSTRPRTSMGVDYNRSFGDPTYAPPTRREAFVIDTRSGERIVLFPEPRVLGNAAWSPDGATLALLAQGSEDRFDLLLWDRASRKATPVRLPAGRYATGSSDLDWSSDGRTLYASLRSEAWRAKAAAEFARLTTGPRIVQSSTEPFLAWNGLSRMGTIESAVAITVERGRAGAMSDLLPEAMTQQWRVTADGRTLVYTEDITKKTDYDVIGGSEQRLLMRDLPGGAPATVFATLRGIRPVWARDGRRYAYLSGDLLLVGTLGDTARRRIAGDTTARGDTSAAARGRRARERFTPVAWLPDGATLVATNPDGMWTIDAASGARRQLAVANDSVRSTPRLQYIGASGDGQRLFLGMQSRTTWTRGILRYDRASGRLDTLVADNRHYGGFTVSEDGSTIVVSGGDGNRPYDLWVMSTADARPSLRRLTDANPTLATKGLGKTSLLTYLDADGKPEFGVVHYPRGYVEGRAYPTVFIIYEDFFADTWDAVANLLNANGYVVVKPSVSFDIGYPGEAWVKGVTAAANKLVEMGIADSARLGVHGTSYGGYATNLLITQTARFKAAVNISGKVDMISFYTDSPRLGVRNVHAAEKSQDRLGATLWQQPQKYVAHSAVMFADRITTPLLLMTGELDANVPAINTREMYYALRRLGKEVTWVTYAKGGHGTPLSSLDDWTDFHERLLAWYERHLKRGLTSDTPTRGNE
jgi:dipeptidyl aminopeptidase/acylaminoacyl peptidase